MAHTNSIVLRSIKSTPYQAESYNNTAVINHTANNADLRKIFQILPFQHVLWESEDYKVLSKKDGNFIFWEY